MQSLLKVNGEIVVGIKRDTVSAYSMNGKHLTKTYEWRGGDIAYVDARDESLQALMIKPGGKSIGQHISIGHYRAIIADWDPSCNWYIIIRVGRFSWLRFLLFRLRDVALSLNWRVLWTLHIWGLVARPDYGERIAWRRVRPLRWLLARFQAKGK
jgi:hypothetical protein